MNRGGSQRKKMQVNIARRCSDCGLLVFIFCTYFEIRIYFAKPRFRVSKFVRTRFTLKAILFPDQKPTLVILVQFDKQTCKQLKHLAKLTERNKHRVNRPVKVPANWRPMHLLIKHTFTFFLELLTVCFFGAPGLSIVSSQIVRIQVQPGALGTCLVKLPIKCANFPRTFSFSFFGTRVMLVILSEFPKSLPEMQVISIGRFYTLYFSTALII